MYILIKIKSAQKRNLFFFFLAILDENVQKLSADSTQGYKKRFYSIHYLANTHGKSPQEPKGQKRRNRNGYYNYTRCVSKKNQQSTLSIFGTLQETEKRMINYSKL